MSMKTWRAQYYPTPAENCRTAWTNATNSREELNANIAAVRHSLCKWQGLLPANLKRHQCKKNNFAHIRGYRGAAALAIDTDSCALCQIHRDEYLYGLESCGDCPIVALLGHSCTGNDERPYEIWQETGDPAPMIKVLRRTLKMLMARKAKLKKGKP